jgi:hypothetical protein
VALAAAGGGAWPMAILLGLAGLAGLAAHLQLRRPR